MMRGILAVFIPMLMLATAYGQKYSWPESLAMIDSLDGLVLINDREAVAGSTFPAAGNKIITGDDGYAVIAFSNGMVVYCGPSSQLTIGNAWQKEYADVYAGGRYENTSSDIVIELEEGKFGFYQPDPNPTSRLALRTRYGTVEGDAKAFAITLGPKASIAAALEGNLSLETDNGSSNFIAEGEALHMRELALQGPGKALRRIQNTERVQLEALIEPAIKTARRTLFIGSLGEPGFRNAIYSDALKGTAYNDYRLAD